MNQQVLGLAAIAIMLTVFVSLQVGEGESDQPQGRVFEGLSQQLDEITGISISQPASGESVLLSRDQEDWVLDPPGYPADREAVSRFLVALGELAIDELKTARPENHGRLGLEQAGDDAGVIIRLMPGEWELMVGREGTATGQFARYPKEDQAFLTSEPVDVSTSAMDWINPVAINIDEADVISVTIGEQLHASRDADSGDWEVRDLPEDRALRYPGVLADLGRMLVNVRFTEVGRFDAGLFAGARRTTVRLSSGESVEILTVEDETGYWLHLTQGEPSPWQYKISEFTYNAFNKNIEDLLEP